MLVGGWVQKRGPRVRIPRAQVEGGTAVLVLHGSVVVLVGTAAAPLEGRQFRRVIVSAPRRDDGGHVRELRRGLERQRTT
eukprot:4465216-Prymnesium_polylepis.1